MRVLGMLACFAMMQGCFVSVYVDDTKGDQIPDPYEPWTTYDTGGDTAAPEDQEPQLTVDVTVDPGMVVAGDTYFLTITVEGDAGCAEVEAMGFSDGVTVFDWELRGDVLLVAVSVDDAFSGPVSIFLDFGEWGVVEVQESMHVEPAGSGGMGGDPSSGDGSGGSGSGGEGPDPFEECEE